MPELTEKTSGKRFALNRRSTTIGSSSDANIRVEGAADAHARISFDGTSFFVDALDDAAQVLVNGKKVVRHRLADGENLRVGPSEFGFSLYDTQKREPTPHGESLDVAALARLQRFSALLAEKYELPALLERLMDAVIEITRADKGFLILVEDGKPVVKVARNLKQESIADAVARLSDSIVSKAMREKRAVIVSDALHDQEFKSSESVMSLKLCSVMVAPLLERGELLGLIYVGNDNVVNLFEPKQLDVLSVFAAQAALILRAALTIGELVAKKGELEVELETYRFGSIIGTCEPLKEVLKKVARVATADVSVLVEGETGTGKELIARELHVRSPRQKGPFVVINCGAIPENLLESELFGHVRGAFTGAVQNRIGKFQAANGGTLFLDEIGELPLNLQVKLLRVLQEREVTKVGDSRTETIDIRIVAATNRDLEVEMKAGRFREDLYYRLSVVKLRLPPLRERGEDTVVLAKYLLQRYAKEYSSKAKGFTQAALIALKKARWPGNIRQLENQIKRAAVLAERPLLGPEDMEIDAADLPPIKPLQDAKEEFQRRYIDEVLARNNGNRTKTAKDLGVDPRTIFRHLEKDDSGEQGGEASGA